MKDYLKKEPTKNEQLIHEMLLYVRELNLNINSVYKQLLAVAKILDVKPNALAELMVNDEKTIMEYSKTLGQEIEQLESAKTPPKSKPEESPKSE